MENKRKIIEIFSSQCNNMNFYEKYGKYENPAKPQSLVELNEKWKRRERNN